MKRDYKKLVKDVNEILQKYELGDYSFESMDIVSKLMPIDDETFKVAGESMTGSEDKKIEQAAPRRCRIVHHPDGTVELICD